MAVFCTYFALTVVKECAGQQRIRLYEGEPAKTVRDDQSPGTEHEFLIIGTDPNVEDEVSEAMLIYILRRSAGQSAGGPPVGWGPWAWAPVANPPLDIPIKSWALILQRLKNVLNRLSNLTNAHGRGTSPAQDGIHHIGRCAACYTSKQLFRGGKRWEEKRGRGALRGEERGGGGLAASGCRAPTNFSPWELQRWSTHGVGAYCRQAGSKRGPLELSA
ncbi:hypothetical protein UY3_05378 [Chelonia mydas]|uniref:Uncharacterized protein n=1 Tax=Chelonia mydas TaxID=8469 RepID=M7C9U4_CHEMY|nr:hypothetical protein UY3_05378 [Chelonia mydas]